MVTLEVSEHLYLVLSVVKNLGSVKLAILSIRHKYNKRKATKILATESPGYEKS